MNRATDSVLVDPSLCLNRTEENVFQCTSATKQSPLTHLTEANRQTGNGPLSRWRAACQDVLSVRSLVCPSEPTRLSWTGFASTCVRLPLERSQTQTPEHETCTEVESWTSSCMSDALQNAHTLERNTFPGKAQQHPRTKNNRVRLWFKPFNTKHATATATNHTTQTSRLDHRVTTKQDADTDTPRGPYCMLYIPETSLSQILMKDTISLAPNV